MTQFPQVTQSVAETVEGRPRTARRAVQVEISPTAIRLARAARRQGTSSREQLIAAASSLVWFAAWFHSIYEDIRGESPEK